VICDEAERCSTQRECEQPAPWYPCPVNSFLTPSRAASAGSRRVSSLRCGSAYVMIGYLSEWAVIAPATVMTHWAVSRSKMVSSR
jgi:hypothetical protein